MTKNGLNPSLNADAADAVFAGYSGPTTATPSADGLPERHRETRLSENTIERSEKVAAARKAQSILQRVRGLLGSLFGSDGRRPRSRSRSYRSEYAYVSMLRAERLEERLCMSASPVAAEVGSMFTDTTHTQLEQDIEANLTAMYAELSQLDAQISGMPAALSLQWNPSSTAGWTGELAPQRTSWMHDSVLTGSGKFLVAGFQDGAIEIRNTETGAVLSTLNSGVGRSYFFSANPTNDIVYVSAGAGAGSKLIAIDAARGTELWRASGGDSANRSSVTADGKFVLVDIDNLGVATFDAQTGALLSRSQEQDYGGNAVGQDMTVFNAGRELWLQRKNGSRTLLTTVDGMAYETAVSPDQQRIAVGGSGGTIVVVNLATGTQTRWTGHGASVTDVAFTDNQTLAVGHDDGTVELWNISGASPVKTTSLQTGQGYVYGMDAVNGVLVLRTGGNTPRWKALNYADTTQRDALLGARSDLQATITTEESRLSILEASATPDAVPYAFTLMDQSDSQNGSPESHELVTAPVSMQIARDGDMDTLSIKTPFDETHIPSPFGTLHFSHQGGTENLTVLRRHFSEMFNPNPSVSPELTFTAYADSALTKAVFDVTVRIDRATGQVTISSGVPRSIERGMLPSGVEAEPAAALQIASVTGPNAIVMVSAQHDAVIRFAGVHDDGVLSRASVRGDGELRATSLTINTSNPTGDYALIMTDSDGRDLGRQNVHWDSDTKQLSVPGGIVWSGSPEADAEAQNVRMLMQDPGLGDRALSAAQGSLMVDMMDSLPAPYCHLIKSFDQAVLDAHPEWSDEALRAKAISTHGSFSMTEAFDALVRNRNDEMRLLRSAYGTYQSLVGDLLKQASTLLSRIRSGGNENQLRHDFAVTVDTYSTGLAMTQLASIGIRIPNPDTLLAAAKCLWDVKGEELMTLKQTVERQQVYQQQLVAAGFVQSSDGTYMAANDPRLETVRYYVDQYGRLTTLAPNLTLADTGTLHGAAGNVVASASDDIAEVIAKYHQKYVIRNGENFVKPVSLPVAPEGTSTIEIVIDEEKMVSFGVPGMSMRDITLTISGSGLGTQTYSSHKDGVTGESISLRLPAGTYKLSLSDVTNYGDIAHSYLKNMEFNEQVQVDIRKFNNADIHGLISVKESTKVMPVSMRVAEFYTDTSGSLKRNDNYDGKDPNILPVSKLDPTKPVWVVVHGRGDSDDFDPMSELAKNLKSHDVQVVTINWHDAASDNILRAGLQGSKWIEPVGIWVSNQLRSIGFSSANINLIGHSWGTYVSNEVARHIPGGVQTIVALDPAADKKWLGGQYDTTAVNFASVSQNSYAFHSSSLGSQSIAQTADYTFDIRVPEGYEDHSGTLTAAMVQAMRQDYILGIGLEIVDEIDDAYHEHGFAVTLFSELLKERNGISNLFSPTSMRANTNELLQINGKYEGVFIVDPETFTFSSGPDKGKTWWKANRYHFLTYDANGNEITQ